MADHPTHGRAVMPMSYQSCVPLSGDCFGVDRRTSTPFNVGSMSCDLQPWFANAGPMDQSPDGTPTPESQGPATERSPSLHVAVEIKASSRSRSWDRLWQVILSEFESGPRPAGAEHDGLQEAA